MAKQSILTGCHTIYKISLLERIATIKRDVRRQWEDLWKNICTSSSTIYCQIQPNIPQQLWHKEHNYPRKYVTTISGMKFGHASYPIQLHKLHIIQNENCEFSGIPCEMDHILFGWIKYKTQTKNLY